MKSIGSKNSIRGAYVEKEIVKKYGAIKSDSDEYDMEYFGRLVEIKSCASWHLHSGKANEKSHPGSARFSIDIEAHEDLKKAADKMGKKAVYAFVKTPRSKMGRISMKPNTWIEAWMTWENVDRIVKNPKTKRLARNKYHVEDRTRYYYRIPIKTIFGNN